MAEYSFDLHRIFIGDQPPMYLLEVFFRTAVLLLFFLFVVRFMGQRGVGQISLFEFALILSMGSAAGDPMFYIDVPILHGMAAIFVVVFFQQMLLRFNRKSNFFQRLTEGKTERIVADGILDLEGLKRVQLSRNEAVLELRQQSIEHLGQVRRAFFEVDGQVSIFRYSDDEVRPGMPLIPPEMPEQEVFCTGDSVPTTTFYACENCGVVRQVPAGSTFPTCRRCRGKKWMEASTETLPTTGESQS